MNLMQVLIRWLLIGISALLLTACIPHFKYPLSKAEKAEIDERILGSWYWHEEFETGFLHIGLNDNHPKLLRIIMLDIDENNRLEIAEFSAHTSTLDEQHYLNLRTTTPKDPDPGYMLMKYKTDKHILGVAFIQRSKIKNAIENNRLKGEIQDSVLFPSIFVTEKPKKLRRFIRKHEPELFQKMTMLKKINFPYAIHPEQPPTGAATSK